VLLMLAAGPAGAAELRAPPGASSCSGCHGPPAAGIPPLAGLSADAIAGALADFRSGRRPATVMNRIAKGFSEEESRAIAAWLAARGGP
jgi:cytochrome subunit of sulfide dehydrogenase